LRKACEREKNWNKKSFGVLALREDNTFRSFVRLQMTKLHGQPEGLYWSFSKNVIMITSDKTSHPSSGQNAEVITPEMSKNIHPVY
jgi:hypothetical protein